MCMHANTTVGPQLHPPCKYSHKGGLKGAPNYYTAAQLEPAELDVPSSMDPSEDHAVSEPLTSAMLYMYNVSWKADSDTALELV